MLSWKAPAAYLYVLRLDQYGLAWEYLRRNVEYREHWKQQINCPDPVTRWGCAAFENPDRDARSAYPQWVIETPEQVHLIPVAESHQGDYPFSLWALRGSRSLLHMGSHVLLHVRSSLNSTQVRMQPMIEEGQSCAFVMRADRWVRDRMRAASTVVEQLFHPHAARNVPRVPPFNRAALIHARTLQALDGIRAGASQRDIASAVLGDHRVQAQWTADGELRAQVRYLIRRGRAWVNGDYRSLLKPIIDQPQGETEA